MPSSFTISLDDANTVSWVFGAVAIALTIGRYAIRWRIIRKFHADDIAHLAAVLFMIAELAVYNALIPTIKDMTIWGNGGPEKPDEFTLGEQLSDIEHCLFISALWSVKVAFMLMYRTLFRISKPFNVAWWSVLLWNVLTYLLCMLTILWFCGGDVKYIANYQVCESDASTPMLRKIYVITFISVVTSDLAVMILPLYMLRTLRMRKGQKFGVAVIFSLSMVSVIFETVRLAKSFMGGNTLNVLWMHLEETFAVIVSALPAYYSLFNWGKEWYSRRSSQKSLGYSSYGSGSGRSGSIGRGPFSGMPPSSDARYHASVSAPHRHEKFPHGNGAIGVDRSRIVLHQTLHTPRSASDSEDSMLQYKEMPALPRENV